MKRGTEMAAYSKSARAFPTSLRRRNADGQAIAPFLNASFHDFTEMYLQKRYILGTRMSSPGAAVNSVRLRFFAENAIMTA